MKTETEIPGPKSEEGTLPEPLLTERKGLISPVLSAQRDSVAQICNLPYRRFVIGKASGTSSAVPLADMPQNAILRYSRLQICATLNTYAASPRLNLRRARRSANSQARRPRYRAVHEKRRRSGKSSNDRDGWPAVRSPCANRTPRASRVSQVPYGRPDKPC